MNKKCYCSLTSSLLENIIVYCIACFFKEHLISEGQQYTTNINKKRTTTQDTKGNQKIGGPPPCSVLCHTFQILPSITLYLHLSNRISPPGISWSSSWITETLSERQTIQGQIKRTKTQTVIHKILHRKLRTKQQ